MASNGKWETVVNKKKSHVTKSDVKKAQQKFIEGEKIPKVDHRDPIKLDETVYSAGFASKKLQESSSDDEHKYPSRIPYGDDDLSSRSPRNVKRREKKVPKQAPVVNMTEKIQMISHDVLVTKIKEVQTKFPSSQLIWLKEVTGWLHSELNGPNEKGDIAYMNKPDDYPLCDVTANVKKTLVNLLRKCDKNVLNSFFTFLLASLTSEVQQGHSTVADRFLLQILCEIRPEVVAENCNEAVSNKSRNSDSYLAIIWALSQGHSSPKKDLEVWWTSMYSTLDKKHHAAASMKYLLKVLCSPELKNQKSSLLTSEQMGQLIELMVATNSPLLHTPSLMESLEDHWDTICNLLLGNGSNDQGKTVFSNILSQLRNKEDAGVCNKICDLLVKCLLTSRNTLAWWEENIIHHMKESSVLLKYIQTRSDAITDQMNRFHRSKKVFYFSTQRMVEKLEKANEKGRFEKKPGYKDCKKLCLAYIRHEESRKHASSKLWKFIKIFVLLIAAVVSYDLYSHKGYKGSVTSVYMKQYGIENRALVAFTRSKQLADSVTSYCETHVPYYYSKVSIYIEPALEVTWHYVSIATRFIYKHSQPLRFYANQYIPPLLEKEKGTSQDVDVKNQITFFLSEQYRIITTFALNLFNEYAPIVQNTLSNTYAWLLHNIPLAYHYVVNLLITLQQKIYELSPSTFDQLSLAISDAWQYVVKMTPIVMETVEGYANKCIVTGRGYAEKGQEWFQQTLVNASPSTHAK